MRAGPDGKGRLGFVQLRQLAPARHTEFLAVTWWLSQAGSLMTVLEAGEVPGALGTPTSLP